MEKINYMQIVQQTDKEKLAMYMKVKKKQLAEMLIQCNKIIDANFPIVTFGDCHEKKSTELKCL